MVWKSFEKDVNENVEAVLAGIAVVDTLSYDDDDAVVVTALELGFNVVVWDDDVVIRVVVVMGFELVVYCAVEVWRPEGVKVFPVVRLVEVAGWVVNALDVSPDVVAYWIVGDAVVVSFVAWVIVEGNTTAVEVSGKKKNVNHSVRIAHLPGVYQCIASSKKRLSIFQLKSSK